MVVLASFLLRLYAMIKKKLDSKTTDTWCLDFKIFSTKSKDKYIELPLKCLKTLFFVEKFQTKRDVR